MKTFKFLPGFLPFKAIYGYKGKIIKYCEEEVRVNGFETRLRPKVWPSISVHNLIFLMVFVHGLR